jgi:hypothetical protein
VLPLHLWEYKRLLLAKPSIIRKKKKKKRYRATSNCRRITQVALRILRNGAHAMKNPFE